MAKKRDRMEGLEPGKFPEPSIPELPEHMISNALSDAEALRETLAELVTEAVRKSFADLRISDAAGGSLFSEAGGTSETETVFRKAMSEAWLVSKSPVTGSIEDPEVELVQRAADVLGSENVGKWFQTPIPSLKGKTPYSLMGSEKGRQQVETVLGKIEHGVY